MQGFFEAEVALAVGRNEVAAEVGRSQGQEAVQAGVRTVAQSQFQLVERAEMDGQHLSLRKKGKTHRTSGKV